MLWGMHLLVCVCVSSFLLPVPVLLAFPFFYDDDDDDDDNFLIVKKKNSCIYTCFF